MGDSNQDGTRGRPLVERVRESRGMRATSQDEAHLIAEAQRAADERTFSNELEAIGGVSSPRAMRDGMRLARMDRLSGLVRMSQLVHAFTRVEAMFTASALALFPTDGSDSCLRSACELLRMSERMRFPSSVPSPRVMIVTGSALEHKRKHGPEDVTRIETRLRERRMERPSELRIVADPDGPMPSARCWNVLDTLGHAKEGRPAFRWDGHDYPLNRMHDNVRSGLRPGDDYSGIRDLVIVAPGPEQLLIFATWVKLVTEGIKAKTIAPVAAQIRLIPYVCAFDPLRVQAFDPSSLHFTTLEKDSSLASYDEFMNFFIANGQLDGALPMSR